jgi:hypothetical protein
MGNEFLYVINGHLSGLDIHFFMKPLCLLLCCQEAVTFCYLSNPFHTLAMWPLRSILILSSYLRVDLANDLLLSEQNVCISLNHMWYLY